MIKKLKGRKAQISIFIIIGIVLLLSVGLAFVVKDILNKEKPPELGSENEEVADVVEFVDSCMNRIGKEAVVRIGAQGGYFNTTRAGLYAIPNMPTMSNSLEFAPGSGILIPYWFYMDSSDSCTSNCQFSSERPSLYAEQGSLSVESQIKDYIDTHIGKCVNNLDDYRSRFEITITGELESTVRITEDNILVTAEFPVQLHQDNFDTSLLREYQTILDVDFKSIYGIASDITMLEMNNDYRFLEKVTKEVIAAYSGDPASEMPPVAGSMSFDLGGIKTWRKSKAKKELEFHLTNEIPTLQIMGSRESTLLFDPNNAIFTGLYKNMMIFMLNSNQNDVEKLKIDFKYLPWWQSYMKINPGSGELIMPARQGFNAMLFLPIQLTDYRFSYDSSYPVMVTLRDPDAFNGEGYLFQYAIEVNLRNGEPLLADIQELEIENVESTFFASPGQRNSGDIKITTVDSNNVPLPEVTLSYYSADEELFLGSTSMDQSEAVLHASLPLCIGCFVGGYIEDYFVRSTPLDLQEIGETAEAVVEAEKIVKKNLSVMLKIVDKHSLSMPAGGSVSFWNLSSSAVNVHPDEDLMLILTREPGIGEAEFIRAIELNGSSERDAEIELVSGRYELQGFITRNMGENYSLRQVVIPASEYCYDTEPLNPFGGEECAEIPKVELNDSLYRGGVTFTETNGGLFEITKQDLQSHNEIVIYLVVPDYNDYEILADLEQMGKTDEYSVTYRASLLPEWR
ncbi:MAG: hypothetical protein V1659_04970 [Candidatus Woesearchaeota archaeon]